MTDQINTGKLILGSETYRMLGACFEVYKQMGCGFLESAYVDCLRIELAERRIPFVYQPRFELKYKGCVIEHFYVPDLICYDAVILEVKAVNELSGAHQAQIINYLRTTGLTVGLLANFGHHPMLEHQRFAARRIEQIPNQEADGESVSE